MFVVYIQHWPSSFCLQSTETTVASEWVCFSSSIATTPACLPGSRGILASYTVNTGTIYSCEKQVRGTPLVFWNIHLISSRGFNIAMHVYFTPASRRWGRVRGVGGVRRLENKTISKRGVFSAESSSRLEETLPVTLRAFDASPFIFFLLFYSVYSEPKLVAKAEHQAPAG